jgi:CRISPR-associated endonuclease/helicase Cas3
MLERAPNHSFFCGGFKALAGGTDPYPWQEDLFSRLLRNQIPSECYIPTGLGKTSVILIWMLALAWQIVKNNVATLPRRLVYVVNRRTIVDQATAIVEAMATTLASSSTEQVRQIAMALRAIATTPLRGNSGSPLALSTLRGELADNEEWKKDPARRPSS